MNLEKCKMTKTIMLLTGAIAIGMICGCATVREKPADLVVRDDGLELKFVEVSGTSRLPVDYYFGEGDKSKIEEVTLPRYWVAERPITHGEYAKVMECEIPEWAQAEESVSGISWMQAFYFVERLNERYGASLPKGYRFSFPNVVEWQHAEQVVELRKSVGEDKKFFIFTGTGTGMMLYTDSGEEFNAAPKRMRMANIGLLPVAVPIYANSGQFGAPYIARAKTLSTNGLAEESQAYYELLLENGGMDADDIAHTKRLLETANDLNACAYDDWYDMLLTIGDIVDEKGYEKGPIVDGWMMAPCLEVENEEVSYAYARHGIRGEFVRVGDLPESVRADQTICLNGEEVLMCFSDEDGFKSGRWQPSTNTVVEVLNCDFDGDGFMDMVVEQFASIGSGGYWYNFYRQEADGSYANVLEHQTVGLCAVAAKDSPRCAFVTLEKTGNPTLMPQLMVYKGEGFKFEELGENEYCMLDATGNGLYTAAPFIGGGFGLGWMHLQGRNVWQSPLYWPWEPGIVQGYEEARANAKANSQEDLRE